MAKPPDAFLSYTRFDDRRGDISAFRQWLSDAVQEVTGEPFSIFQDVEGIGLGEHWPGKLDQMLEEARFFIPILTPSYFRSNACRDELEKFLKAEKNRGRHDLVLPIYYIESDVLENAEVRTADALATALHERQREDWWELRHHPFEAREVRRALEKLARGIARARWQSLPSSSRGSVMTTGAPAASATGVEEQTEFDVILAAVGEKRINVVKEVRWIMGLSVAEAKDLVSGAPKPVKEGVSKEEAEQVKEQLERQGATVQVKPTQGLAFSLQSGTLFRDIEAPWCPEVVVIPPGVFMMGSTEAERQWGIGQGASRHWVKVEQPQHPVRIEAPLAIGRYAVTLEEYDRFADAAGREKPRDEGWGRGRRPVINVSWEDAKAYVGWLKKETGQPYRLLSEAEWEYAAQAGTTTRHWWGDEITSENANFDENVGKTSEVGSYPQNPWGLCEMNGNVWEWAEDCWNESYEGAPDDSTAWTSGDCSLRVIKGGSWKSKPGILRAAYRNRHKSRDRENNIGFRSSRRFHTQRGQ